MRKSTISLALASALAAAAWALIPVQSAMAWDEPGPSTKPAPPKVAQKAAKGEIKLADDAPDRYIVVKGDTLWSISARFLKDPWRWPDVWRMNQDEVKNPQRIFPGNIIVLDRSRGEPQLKLALPINETRVDPKVRAQVMGSDIPSISPAIIEPFLSQPLVIEQDAMDSAPRVAATQEDRVYVGSGNKIYVTGVVQKQNLWQVYRPGKALVDPDGGATLGYEAIYLGTAQVLREGNPATFEIITAMQEIGRDDRLIPAAKALPLSYVPHSPDNFVQGRVIASYSGVAESGRNSIISINRGARDGIEIGHVLAVYRYGEYFDDDVAAYPDASGSAKKKYSGEGPDISDPLVQKRAKLERKKVHLKMPDERYGLIFVFRVFERVSYALVLNVSRPVNTNDVVQTP